MNKQLLDSLEFIYEHPDSLFLLFVEKKSDIESMRAFFPDVPVCDGSSTEYAQQAFRAFREGKIRGLVLSKFRTTGWNVFPPENKPVAVLFSYVPERNEFEQAQSRVRRPLTTQKELNHVYP
jgi:hypothetical protein